MPPSISDYRQRLANTSIGPTTLRNQGAPGVVDAARDFLKQLDLARLVTDSEAKFSQELDLETGKLQQSFPDGAKENWGAARKSIDLFLAEAYYHQFVCKEYGLDRIAGFLEVPLDSQVAIFLQEAARGTHTRDLPKWHGIKYVTPQINRKYQEVALAVANSFGPDWTRVHLDVIAWGR